MSDVERICAVNHARVRWAEEYADVEPVVDLEKEEDPMERYRIFKAGTMLSFALTGIGVAFLCIGLCMMHAATIIMGFIITLAFFICGYYTDKQAEEELDHVLSP